MPVTNRTYKQKMNKGKVKLVLHTWTQNRCKICQRFLSMKQILYCSKHGSIEEENHRHNHNESRKEWVKNFRQRKDTKEIAIIRVWIYRNIETLNIGDIF